MVVVVACLVAACSPADEAAGPAESLQRSAQLRVILAPGPLVGALQRERAVSVTNVMDMADLVGQDPQDLHERRAGTDRAIADVEAETAESDQAASVLRPALGALDRLDELRRHVDARSGAGDLSDPSPAREVLDRYTDLIAGMLDAGTSVAETVDDQGLRLGAELVVVGRRQIEVMAVLTQVLMFTGLADTSGLDQPSEVSEVSELYGEMLEGQAAAVELASGSDYERPAQRLAADLEATGLHDVVTRALESGQLDVGAFLDSMSTLGEGGWYAFLERVEDVLTR
jgi:hypothetical protein